MDSDSQLCRFLNQFGLTYTERADPRTVDLLPVGNLEINNRTLIIRTGEFYSPVALAQILMARTTDSKKETVAQFMEKDKPLPFNSIRLDDGNSPAITLDATDIVRLQKVPMMVKVASQIGGTDFSDKEYRVELARAIGSHLATQAPRAEPRPAYPSNLSAAVPAVGGPPHAG